MMILMYLSPFLMFFIVGGIIYITDNWDSIQFKWWIRRNRFCEYAGIIVNFHRHINYQKKSGYYENDSRSGWLGGSGGGGGSATCGTSYCSSSFPTMSVMSDTTKKGKQLKYEDYYEDRDIFGKKGRIVDIQNHGLVIEMDDKNFTEKRIYVGYESIISDNPNCLLWIGSRKGEILLKNGTYIKSKKLLVKRKNMSKMPRIFKWAIYAAIVDLVWQFVNNAQNIVTFAVSHFIK